MIVYTPSKIKKDAKILKDCLSTFKIRSKLIRIQKDPLNVDFVFKFNSFLDLIKIKKIKQELALATASISGTVGIKVLDRKQKIVRISLPHNDNFKVSFKKFLNSQTYQKSKEILFPIGIDYKGKIIAKKIKKFPNLVIAGFDTSGEETIFNNFLFSVTKKFKPNKIKFLLFDFFPGAFEFFKNSPHLFRPIVFQPKTAVKNLLEIIKEIEKRKREKKKIPEVIIAVSNFQQLTKKDKKIVNQVIRIAKEGKKTGVYIYLSENFGSPKTFPQKMLKTFSNKIAFSLDPKEYQYFLEKPRVDPVFGKGEILYKESGKEIEKLQSFEPFWSKQEKIRKQL